MYLCYIITPRAPCDRPRIERPTTEEGGGGGCEREPEERKGGREEGRGWKKIAALAEEKFFGGRVGPTERERATPSGLMNRNNSRAIVLFGSFQLTLAEPARKRAEWRDAAQL